MLLIPVILWWAHRPMRFAVGRARTATGATLIVFVTLSTISASTLVAEDRYGRESSSTDSSRNDRVPPIASGFVLLREGSQIPPTAGRIVLMGRRWVFLAATGPDIHDKSTAAALPGGSDGADARRLFGEVAFVSTSPSGDARPSDVRPSDVRSSDVRPGEPYAGQASSGDGKSMQIVLTENLNLQRIIEALRSDPADENWIISGQISEFFAENRLTVLTAQRSNRN